MPSNWQDQCPARYTGDGHLLQRRYRCQRDRGHDGMCSYHRAGGQGGTYTQWWGANAKPVGDTFTMDRAALTREIDRLRQLCEQQEIDWRADLREATDADR